MILILFFIFILSSVFSINILNLTINNITYENYTYLWLNSPTSFYIYAKSDYYANWSFLLKKNNESLKIFSHSNSTEVSFILNLSYYWRNLTDGLYTLIVNITNITNSTDYKTIYVYLFGKDTISPMIYDCYIFPNNTVNNITFVRSLVYLVFNVSDNINISRAVVYVNDSFYLSKNLSSNGEWNILINTTNLSYGYNKIKVIIYDLANNSNFTEIIVFVDNISPKLLDAYYESLFPNLTIIFNFSEPVNLSIIAGLPSNVSEYHIFVYKLIKNNLFMFNGFLFTNETLSTVPFSMEGFEAISDSFGYVPLGDFYSFMKEHNVSIPLLSRLYPLLYNYYYKITFCDFAGNCVTKILKPRNYPDGYILFGWYLTGDFINYEETWQEINKERYDNWFYISLPFELDTSYKFFSKIVNKSKLKIATYINGWRDGKNLFGRPLYGYAISFYNLTLIKPESEPYYIIKTNYENCFSYLDILRTSTYSFSLVCIIPFRLKEEIDHYYIRLPKGWNLIGVYDTKPLFITNTLIMNVTNTSLINLRYKDSLLFSWIADNINRNIVTVDPKNYNILTSSIIFSEIIPYWILILENATYYYPVVPGTKLFNREEIIYSPIDLRTPTFLLGQTIKAATITEETIIGK